MADDPIEHILDEFFQRNGWDHASSGLDLDGLVKLHRRSRGRSEACVCGEAYPCRTVALVIEVDRLRDGIRRFLADEDTHEPGPYVKDGNWHTGPCVEGGSRMEDVYPDGFQICADEDCGAYWPCPTAELAALLGDRTETT